MLFLFPQTDLSVSMNKSKFHYFSSYQEKINQKLKGSLSKANAKIWKPQKALEQAHPKGSMEDNTLINWKQPALCFFF